MKAKQMLLVAVLGMLTITAARADDFWTQHVWCVPGGGTYSANEVSLDMFGYGNTHNKNGDNVGAWGLGAGGNYFLTRYFGFGVDSYVDAFVHPYILDGDFLARYPIPNTGFALNGFAGLGRQWSFAPQWLGNVGVGAEYRFASKTSFFSDLRGIFPGQTENSVMWRFGFRIVF